MTPPLPLPCPASVPTGWQILSSSNGKRWVRVAFITDEGRCCISCPSLSKPVPKGAAVPLASAGLGVGQVGVRQGKYLGAPTAWDAVHLKGGESARSAFAPYIPGLPSSSTALETPPRPIAPPPATQTGTPTSTASLQHSTQPQTPDTVRVFEPTSHYTTIHTHNSSINGGGANPARSNRLGHIPNCPEAI